MADTYESPLSKVGKFIIGIFALFFIILMLFAFFPIQIINTGEVGVLLEFGKVKEIWKPGIHLMIPFMNSVDIMSTQIEKFEAEASAASSDLQIVRTTITVNYRLPETDASVQSLYENFKGNHESRIIEPLVQEVVKANTAKYSAAELIAKREQLKTVIGANLKEKLRQYDINVVEVSITNFDFSPEFNRAIEEKVVVEQELLKEQYELQKKQIEVQRIIAEKNASAIGAILEAQGAAEAQLIRAEADARSIQRITQSLTDPYIKYYYIQRWNGQMPKVLGSQDMIIDVSTFVEEPKPAANK